MRRRAKSGFSTCSAVTRVLAITTLLLTNGCGRPTSYLGISLRTGAADPQLQWLAYRAMRGNPRAELELGIAFEEGRGVPRDFAKAARLYSSAGHVPSSAAYTYVPIVVSKRGQVQPSAQDQNGRGLSEAIERLHRLQSKGRLP